VAAGQPGAGTLGRIGARFLAEHIPDAKLVELPGADLSLMWETRELALDVIEEFLTGVRHVPLPRRVLATVLFTDIVGSTERAGELGDRRWRQLLDHHDELAAHLVEEASGRLVKTTGDGILATLRRSRPWDRVCGGAQR
jgi:class 3 adenylate cyclase